MWLVYILMNSHILIISVWLIHFYMLTVTYIDIQIDHNGIEDF
jgi:hypothetical protein